MVTLTVYRGDRIVQELDLEGSEIRIGRGADNAVVLPDDGKGVSRAHAVLRVENGSAVVYDRDSQNGTFVDGKRVKRALVQPGQDIVIGPYRVVLVSVEAAEEDPGQSSTVIAPRTTPPPGPPPSAPDATPRDVTPAPSQNTPRTSQNTPRTTSRVVDPTAGRASAQTSAMRKSPSPLYVVAGVGVAVLAAVLIWQFWPAARQDDPIVAVATTTSSVATTTIPAPASNPYADAIANAEVAMAAAEQTFAAKRYAAAAVEFDRVVTELGEALKAEPPVPEATALRDRAIERANEARRLTPPKVTTTVPNPVDPSAVTRRPDESDLDYDRRNKEAQQDYALARRLLDESDYMGAVRIFEGLSTREPGWRDVSSHLKTAQDALAQTRQSVLDEALRRENAGYTALNERRFGEAASELIAAGKAFERAVALQTPTAEKLATENLVRRRHLGKVALESARTHANNKQTSEAVKLFQVVIDVLPTGDPLRVQAESDLKRIGIGRE